VLASLQLTVGIKEFAVGSLQFAAGSLELLPTAN
jgi:hypothetical protein